MTHGHELSKGIAQEKGVLGGGGQREKIGATVTS